MIIPWILIAVASLLILFFIAFVYIYKGKKHEIDYKGWFYIGIVWLAIGLPLKNFVLFILGLVFVLVGIINKSKWKTSKPWNKLSKEEKKIKLAVMIALGILVVTGIVAFAVYSKSQKRIGGQTDEHGCLIAAGYSYCESKQKCLRMWEDYCEEYKEAFRGRENPELIDSFDDCIHSGYPIMESYPRQCRANNQTFREEIK